MQIPVQVTFRGMPVSDAVEAACWKQAQKLERYFDSVTACRVVVTAPHRSHKKGQLYAVQIDMTVPGHELIVNRERHEDHTHEDVYVAIRDAFLRARRQLEDYVRRLRSQTTDSTPASLGRVVTLVPEEGFGQLVTADGRELTFDRASVQQRGFARLTVGDEVRYVEADDGRCSSVTLVGQAIEESA